jgi:hypothetical protein
MRLRNGFGIWWPTSGTPGGSHRKRSTRNGWTTCRVTACDPGREFSFEVLLANRSVNNWRYEFAPNGDGTDLTESFWVPIPAFLRPTSFLGFLRRRRNVRDMRTTLERIKVVVEA